MSTTIEWTQRPGTKGETWNPTTGCNKLSAGCKHCYAEVMHKRLQAMGQAKYQQDFSAGVVTHADTLSMPLKWKKPRTVFVNSMSDLFHADVPFAFIDQVFAVMALTPQHTYQILTKRPERMAEYMAHLTNGGTTRSAADILSHAAHGIGIDEDTCCAIANWINGLSRWRHAPADNNPLNGTVPRWPLPNVWLGTSVEDQKAADERIPHLLKCPAAVRFLSCEPLLGAVDLRAFQQHTVSSDAYTVFTPFHWVIAGGESGPKARPMHPDWARGLRDECKVSGVPFFFKQWGEWLPAGQGKAQGIRATTVHDGCEWDAVGKHNSGRLLDGVEHNEFPKH